MYADWYIPYSRSTRSGSKILNAGLGVCLIFGALLAKKCLTSRGMACFEYVQYFPDFEDRAGDVSGQLRLDTGSAQPWHWFCPKP